MKVIGWIVLVVTLLIASPFIAAALSISLPLVALALLILAPGIIIGYFIGKSKTKKRREDE